MDFLKPQFERIQRQLAALTATQKMLTASLVAIMVITVLWWGKYAGEPELVSLLSQPLATQDLGAIQERLTNQHVRFTTEGDKVMVPADQRIAILADLTYNRKMPANTSAAFDDIIKQISPWDSENKQERIWNHGKERTLSMLIGQFPDVASANVVINPTDRSRIEDSVVPGASVFVTMQDGKRASQRLVDAAADAVVGATAGLGYAHVKVVVDGLSRKPHDAEADPLGDGDQQLALARENSKAAADSIRELFGDIPGLFVSVTVKLNTTSFQTEEHKFDGKNAVVKPLKTTSETEETTGGANQPGGEAGTGPNTGAFVSPQAQGGGGGTTQTLEKTEEQNQVSVPETRTVSRTPAGGATPIGAAVRVPLSYFAEIFRNMNPEVKEPTFKQVKDQVVDLKLPELRKLVAQAVGLGVNDVAMDMFIDRPINAPQVVPVAQASTMSLLVKGHAREMGLGGLAVMSLFMASMMVRKSAASSPALAMAGAAGIAGTAGGLAGAAAGSQDPRLALLPTGEALAGEATVNGAALDGMELDPDAIRAQQMSEQVATMVREDPDSAAALVKRWLNRT